MENFTDKDVKDFAEKLFDAVNKATAGHMEELKIWLERFIFYTEKKIENMNRLCPDHRNIKRFEGEVNMAKKTVDKIEELSKK